MRIVYKDAEKKNVIIGVFNAANDVEAKQLAEQKAKLEESLTFTDFFLNTYVSAYYVDLEQFTCRIYKRTDALERDYPIITNYLDSITDYISRDVHPEDRDTLLEMVRPERMRTYLEQTPVFSRIFRDISGGTEKYYRLQVIRGSEKNHAAFGFIDITEEIGEQNRRMNEAEEYRKLIESVAASYDVAFAVDLRNDSFRILKESGSLIDGGRCFACFTDAKKAFLDIVHFSDRERMRQALDYGYIRGRLANTNSYDTEYRVLVDGVTAWHTMNVTAIDEDNIAVGFVEADLQQTKLHLEEKRFDEYFALFVIDMDTAMLKILKNEEHYQVVPVGQSVPYAEYLQAMADKLDEDPRAFYRQISDLDYVRRDLETDDKRTYSYKSSHVLGGNTWIDVTAYVILRHEDGTPAMFTLGFSIVDALATARQELQSRMREDMQMIGGLASGYHALYYFNIDEGFFKVYALDGKKLPKAASIAGNGGDPVEVFNRFADSDLVHPDDRHLFAGITVDELRARLAHRKKFTVRFRRNFEGEYRWSEMDVIKYEDIDEQANAIAVGFADRDEEIRGEQERQKQLEEARNAAEAANKSKTDFLFSMSHDIRTPMNAITGFTNMAVKHIDNKEKALECLSKIQRSGSMLLSLINSVLEVSRIESGHAVLEEQCGDVYYSFSNIDNTMQELAKTKDISLSFVFGEVRDRYVYADFSRCMRIFVNVISNAIKYTPEGGRVEVRCEQIEDRKPDHATYRYTVTDNGIGMSEEFQKHIFEQFSRESTATVSGIQGSGLGMSVVKSFVDLMDGSVTVRSRQGEGTAVTIELPFRRQSGERYTDPETGSEISAAVQNAAAGTADFTGKKILLVEDNELNREIAIEILEEEGFLVEDAGDGTEAVSLLQDKGPDHYDFILMDIQMPIMNGYEATKTIRAMYPESHIPIIALSANAFEEDKRASREAGMDDHVAKPINIRELFGVLAKFSR